MARKGALLLLISSFALGPWETPRAAETSPSLLSKLVQGAKVEKELNMVGGGGTWGDADALTTLEKGVNRKYGLNAKINLVPGPSMPGASPTNIKPVRSRPPTYFLAPSPILLN